SGFTGICLTADNVTVAAANIAGDKLRVQLPANNVIDDLPATLELINNHWYGIALVTTRTATSAYTRTVFLYDFTTQTTHPSSGVSISSSHSFYSTGHVLLNTYLTNQENCFLGEFAALSGHNEAWNAANFATYVADPWVFLRGTYSPSAGSLTTPYGRWHASTKSQVI